MTPDLVWMMIIANAVIAAVTIANTWMLAWYNKSRRSRMKQQGTDTDERQPRRKAARLTLLCALMFVLSIIGLVRLMFTPNPSTNIQMFQVAVLVGDMVLAIVFSLIFPMIELMDDHVNLTKRLMEMTAGIAHSLPKKSPTPTVDSDARDSGVRGSP